MQTHLDADSVSGDKGCFPYPGTAEWGKLIPPSQKEIYALQVGR